MMNIDETENFVCVSDGYATQNSLIRLKRIKDDLNLKVIDYWVGNDNKIELDDALRSWGHFINVTQDEKHFVYKILFRKRRS